MTHSPLESFIESLENVPPELERNFTLITDLDRRTLDVMERINKCVIDYELATEPSQRSAIRSQSDELFEKLRSYSDDKVELADRTYDLIDKNIKKLSAMRATTSGDQPVGLEMPVDPNEPKYCYCREVSHGEMVGCDNHECSIEWFHLSCVGLRVAPKANETWYCQQCAPMFTSDGAPTNSKAKLGKANTSQRIRNKGGSKKSRARDRKR